MVKKVPPQPNQDMVNAFAAIDYKNSRLVGTYLGDSLWMSDVPNHCGAIGYWIGNLPVFHAYLIVRRLKLGSEAALEAVRAWVDPKRRGTGLHAHLLQTAAQPNHQSIVGDRDGMTPDAFAAWQRIPNFSIKYFDFVNSVYVAPASVPLHVTACKRKRSSSQSAPF